MAERRFVTCSKCGGRIDKEEYGWVYNEKTRRYTCFSCSNGTRKSSSISHKAMPHQKANSQAVPKLSAKTYKILGTIAKVVGVFIFILSLLLLLVDPSVGISFAILGALFFFWGRTYTKKKNKEENQ